MKFSDSFLRTCVLAPAFGGLLFLGACANNPNTESAGPRIEALGLTRLEAVDPASLAEWYATRFRLVFQQDGAGYVSKDDTNLGTIWVVIDRAPGPAGPQPMEISFFVRNLDRVLGQLSDLGTSPLRLDTDEHGRSKAIVLDPEGNRIELVQR